MLYILTIKKRFNQKGIHPSLIVLRNYINSYGKDNLLICWPGYLSASVKTANLFHKRFPLLLGKKDITQNNPCFFFDGNNGKRMMPKSTPPCSIAKYVNKLYNNYSSTYCPNDDHSKIIAVCDMPIGKLPPKGASIDTFINGIIYGEISVKALLIGSSNQSHNTMTRVSPDKKGECDVFIFDDRYCGGEEGANSLYNTIVENDKVISVVLTKELRSTCSLNSMFKDFLE